MSPRPAASLSLRQGDYVAGKLLGVTRRLELHVQSEVDRIAAGQKRTSICPAEGCWVLLDERCPACAYRAWLYGGVR